MSTILIVDDKPDSLYLLQTLLTGNGFEVAAASDGVQALAVARTSAPDAVVSDILMPGMDGFALCREWKQDAKLRHIPFVFYTATYTDPQDEKLALDMGADRFLVKPMEPDVLLEQIKAVLTGVREDAGTSPREPREAEIAVMRQYNEALVRKLEQKLVQLEMALRQRDESERRLDHLNCVLRSVYNVNQLIMREKGRAPLTHAACRSLVCERGFHGAWIVLTDRLPDGVEGAQVGFGDESFACLMDRIRKGRLPSCCGGAQSEGGLIVTDDPTIACGDCPLAGAYGRCAGMSVALSHNGRRYGCLGVSVPPEFANDEQEASLLSEIAGDIASALHGIEMDAERRELQQIQRAIFDSASDGILLADAETGRFVVGNNAICRMLGYSIEEIQGLSVADAHPADRQEDIRAQFEKQARGDITLAPDIPMKRKDGTVFPADVNAAAVELDGRLHVLGIFRDITARKRLEDQLRQAQKMESMGRLAGGVAHDFNNLLTGITGLAGFVREATEAGSQEREDLTEVLALTDRAAGLTRQLLAFSRQQKLQPEVLNVNLLICDETKMLGRLIGEDVEFRFLPGADVGNVLADAGQIEQIIMNLAVNARDAMPDGGTLIIETANVELDEEYARVHVSAVAGPHIMIAVSDSGCGMDKETQDRIFDPFFTTKEQGKGTGLGLATVYGIVKQHGGNIRVYSELGQGTTFKIYLPRCEGEAEAKKAEGAAEIPASRGETILFAEDEVSVLKLGKRMLESLGYTVLAVPTPSEARLLAERHGGRIHLLITDVVMPEMNGRELAEQLREVCPDMKSLFMSGYSANIVADRGVLDKDVRFIQKPFTLQNLAVKVREALEGER